MLCGISTAALTSCTDLDVDVNSQYTSYPENDKIDPQAIVEAEMSDVYFHWRGTMGRRYAEAQILASDEMVGISFGGDYYDSGTYAHTCLHNFQNVDPSIGWYADVAAGITKANEKMDKFKGMGDAAVAPIRAIRAFYHFILMDSYGDVPIMESTPAEGEAVERQPRADVARWIESELLAAIPYLSQDNNENTYGKPNRWMAEALLVKLYINWPVYTAANVTAYDAASYSNEHLQDVVTYCDDIIQNGPFSLDGGAASFRAKFYPNNGVQIKDFIYAMPYDAETQTGMQYMRPCIWRQANKVDPSYFGMKLSKSVGGNFAVTPEMSNLFSLAGDDRNGTVIGGTIYLYNPTTYEPTTTPWDYNGEQVTLTKNITLDTANETDQTKLDVGKNVTGWSQGYRSIKYFVIDDDFKNDRNQSNDVPIFRLADILLTKAEAIVRGASATNGQTAQSLFNQVRAYAHAPELDHNPSLKELLDERGREFFHENWRRNDMIRFGTFESDYGFHKQGFPTARFDKECRVFPIPQDVLDVNTNWKQNAGF
ncbi:MAG: RagB/SusD family nutrient uptake outer membrane protein [Prevotella sp.]|nr:RagB/SusD family nutrient uptake outer membrane protein [Prevotella sp.]